MPTIQELVQLVAEGDEEAQEQLVKALAEKDQRISSAERDLKLKTDKALRERYPRAFRAYDRGKLDLHTLDDDELVSALEAKENEYAELGVPLSDVVEIEPGAVTPTPDPAQALVGGGATSGPGGAPRDYVYEIVELMNKGTTVHDQAKWQKMLVELNKEGRKDKIAEITQMLEARPIVPEGI